jgi:GDP-L-fucose synthase
MSKVLVTGGSGLVGSALRQIKPDWIYISSKDYDLLHLEDVNAMFNTYNPDIVIHLAANVGGLFKNAANRLDMFTSNVLINQNVLNSAYQHGIKRVICCLSTCIFPDGLNRILTEKDLHLGEPHYSNYGYAYAKRMMEVQCRLYNEIPDFHYQCIIPTNIYGPYDNFHLENSHVIPGLIHKAHLQEDKNIPFKIMGTGQPKRQFIYSLDLANIIVRIVSESIYTPLLICSTPETSETTILEVARSICTEFNIQHVEPMDKQKGVNDGQQIKTASPAKLLTLLPNFQFTPLKDGISQTVKWFKENYDILRK